MIAVVADDFTGAAEIGGIAIRHGLSATITSALSNHVMDHVDVLIVATNTREESPQQASNTINSITQKLLTFHPKLIFKKIDSVLRGNVGVELLQQMKVMGKQKALVVPANPSLQRTIINGVYYYQGAPLNRSSFMAQASDEKQSSHVVDLIGAPFKQQTVVISKGDELPVSGLAIGNTENEEDLMYWARQMNEQTIGAGGSGFFNAILTLNQSNEINGNRKIPKLGLPRLFVCGSAFAHSRNIVKTAKKNGQLVYNMPYQFFDRAANQKQLGETWAQQIIEGLNTDGTAIVAIDMLGNTDGIDLPTALNQAMAHIVQQVVSRINIAELAIEGGATAAAIIEKLNFREFYPVQEFSTGVIRMGIKDKQGMFLTLKPGSYQWPKSLWNDDSMPNARIHTATP